MTLAGLAAFDLHHGRTFSGWYWNIGHSPCLAWQHHPHSGLAGAYEAAVIFGCMSLGMNATVRVTAFAIAFHWWIHLVQSLSALVYCTHPHYVLGMVLTQLRRKAFREDMHKPANPAE